MLGDPESSLNQFLTGRLKIGIINEKIIIEIVNLYSIYLEIGVITVLYALIVEFKCFYYYFKKQLLKYPS